MEGLPRTGTGNTDNGKSAEETIEHLAAEYYENTLWEFRDWFHSLEWRLDQLEAEKSHRRALTRARRMPVDNNLDHEVEDLFYDWYFSTNPAQRNDSLEIEQLQLHGLGREWFKGLMAPLGKIENFHVDAVMSVHAGDTMKMQGIWLENWSFIDTACWVALNKPHSDHDSVQSFIEPYARGLKPLDFGMAWDDAEKIYGIGDVGGDEWVLYEICLEDQVITVYTSNCMTPGAGWNRIQAKFQNMAMHLPGLLHSLSLIPQINPVWPILRSNLVGEAKGVADTGILALEAFRMLTDGESMQDVQAQNVLDCRMRYCTELYKLGMQHE